MTQRSRRTRRLRRVGLLVVAMVLVAVAFGSVAVATNAAGLGDRWESVLARVDRFLAGPVPDRPTVATVRVTDPPATPTPTPTAEPTPRPSVDPDAIGPDPTATPAPPPTPTPEPVREAIDFDLLDDPDDFFASQVHKDWCAVAGTQMVLAIHGQGGLSESFQREIGGRVREWESRDDSRNGDWGPAAMALALDAYGVPGYEVRAFESRQSALRDSARAIQSTGAPVDPARLARRPYVGHDRVPGRRRPERVPRCAHRRHLHPGPLVPTGLVDLGSLRSARHLPERVGDGAQLPEVAPTGGSLSGP